MSSGDNSVSDIRVSNNIKKFLSDIVTDFITRVTPQADILMNSKKIKTVNEKIIITVVKQLLIDSYPKKSACMNLTPEHAKLFDEVKKKVTLCQEYQTGVVTKEVDEEPEVMDPEDISGHVDDPTKDAVATTPVGTTEDELDTEGLETAAAEQAVTTPTEPTPKKRIVTKVIRRVNGAATNGNSKAGAVRKSVRDDGLTA